MVNTQLGRKQTHTHMHIPRCAVTTSSHWGFPLIISLGVIFLWLGSMRLPWYCNRTCRHLAWA